MSGLRRQTGLGACAENRALAAGRGRTGRWLAGSAVLIAIAALAIAWRATPLREIADVNTLVQHAERIRAMPLAPLLVAGAFVAGALSLVPLVLMIVLTVTLFGAYPGALYALGGALASAACGYAIGRLLGRDAVCRLAGQRVNALSAAIGRRGLVAVVLARVLPLAPFTIVNVIVGASQIGWRDFLLGSLVGFAPGILATALVTDRAAAAMQRPGPASFAMLLAVAAAALVLVAALRPALRKAAAAIAAADATDRPAPRASDRARRFAGPSLADARDRVRP